MPSGNDQKHLGHEIFGGSVSERIGEREGKCQHITCKISPCEIPSGRAGVVDTEETTASQRHLPEQ